MSDILQVSQNKSLLNSSLVECLGVFCRILQVLLIGAGEVVGTAEILLGAHVDVLVLYVVEHGVDACHRRDADRTRRKSRILIRIIRALDRKSVV